MTSNKLGSTAVAFFIIVAGCTEEQRTAAPEAPKVSVRQPAKRELTNYGEYNGWLQSEQTLEVRARVRGHIKKVHFTDGQMVKKGDLLFELDPRPFEAEIGRKKDQVRIYEAQKVAADKDYVRLSELQKKGGASVQQVEKAEADAKAIDAQISAGQNEIKRAELELEYSKITADIAGRISKAELTEGNLVNAGGSDPLLTTIKSIDPIDIYFNIDERLLQQYVKDRQAAGEKVMDALAALRDKKVEFTFAQDGEKEFSHKGTLSFGDNRIDPATGTILVYGTAANPDGRYVPGAHVRIRLPFGKPHDALLVPETAILADQDKRYVLIADAKNEAKRRNVTLGTLTDDGMRAITPADTLPDGEKPADWRVIVDNLQRARLNYPVDPQQQSATTKASS